MKVACDHDFCCVILQENPDLWILGKQSIDGDSNQTGNVCCFLPLFHPSAGRTQVGLALCRSNVGWTIGLAAGYVRCEGGCR
jgi:hypothetical protein